MTAVEPSLDDKIERIDECLRAARIPHAFGGALALAYYAEPRATIDVDLNVFVSPARAGEVVHELGPLGVVADGRALRRVESDGQARLSWGSTPLDLFFAFDPFHDACARRIREVPFGSVRIPILAPEHLLVCKVVFDRRKDWIDVEQVLFATAGELDLDEIRHWLSRILSAEDRRRRRLDSAVGEVLGW